MVTRESSRFAPQIREHSPINFDGVTYIYGSWEQMGEYTYALAQQMIDAGKAYDRVVAVAKGGWTWTRTLVDYLDMDSISSLRIKSYKGVENAGKPYLVQPLTDSVGGQNVLLFDEVIDSGHTTKYAKNYLLSMGAETVNLATLCYKPKSVIRPEFFAFETSAWVVFPHEVREFIELSFLAWKDKHTIAQIKKRLLDIGIPRHHVEYFLMLTIQKYA